MAADFSGWRKPQIIDNLKNLWQLVVSDLTF